MMAKIPKYIYFHVISTSMSIILQFLIKRYDADKFPENAHLRYIILQFLIMMLKISHRYAACLFNIHQLEITS
jgi:hypothetical protein